MKNLAFALLLAAAPAFAGDLRLFNASDQPVTAKIGCAGGSTLAVVAAHDFTDASGDDCRVVSAAPLTVLRLESNENIEWQLAEAEPNESCPATAPLFLPPNGCRLGSAIASVAPVDGAAYSWSIDGGSILSGEGTEHILIALEGGNVARVSAAITKNGCTTTATGVMALHDALRIAALDPGKGNVNEPRTVTWVYANGEPSTQVLSGPDFPQPVTLDPSARSYTFTPLTAGDHEVVLQASLAQLLGRSRAAGHGGGGASSCGTARASSAFHVDCTRPETNISVPGSVGRGKPFLASITLAPGSSAAWKISNATPETATGDSVTITPNNDNPIEVSVTVTAVGGCSATASAHVVIDLTGVCDNPTVKVAIKENDCGGTIVEAIFTGKPPFRGTWSDGVPFLSNGFTVDRVVPSGTVTYSVATFSDTYCAGAASNAVTLTAKKPTVTLSPSGFCAGKSTTVTAAFTGTPPFSGRWSDGTAFSTSSATLQRNVSNGGPLSMTFGDANCSGLTSQTVDLQQPGTATLAFVNGAPACVTTSTKLAVTIAGGTPPYKVTWSDGYVQQSNTSPIERNAYNYTGVYGITRVQDLGCELVLANAIVGAPAAPIPYFSINAYYWPICTGTEYSAVLNSFVSIPAGGSLLWTVENGTITSGQGTTLVKFIPTNPGTSLRVTATLTIAGCPNSYQDYPPPIVAQVKPAQIALSSTSTKAGTPVTITVTGDTQYYTVSASVRPDLLLFVSKPSTNVTVWKYTPAASGTVTFTVHESGTCNGTYVDSSAALTVTP
jgi:hypothetical protein